MSFDYKSLMEQYHIAETNEKDALTTLEEEFTKLYPAYKDYKPDFRMKIKNDYNKMCYSEKKTEGFYKFNRKDIVKEYPELNSLYIKVCSFIEKRKLLCLEMINNLRPYIVSIRNKYEGFAKSYDLWGDLEEAGCLAITENISNFNTEYAPTTFFTPFIKHEMQEVIRSNVANYSAYYSKKIQEISRFLSNADNAKTISASDISVIAYGTGISESTVKTCIDLMQKSKQIALDDLESADFVEEKAVHRPKTPEEAALENEICGYLADALDNDLSKEAAEAIRLYFGFAENPLDLNKIAVRMGLQPFEVKSFINHGIRILKSNKNLSNWNNVRSSSKVFNTNIPLNNSDESLNNFDKFMQLLDGEVDIDDIEEISFDEISVSEDEYVQKLTDEALQEEIVVDESSAKEEIKNEKETVNNTSPSVNTENPPVKRKRGRPRKDEVINNQEMEREDMAEITVNVTELTPEQSDDALIMIEEETKEAENVNDDVIIKPTSDAPAPEKKKRGRPRKNPVEILDVEAPKKKRGRPKKVVEETNTLTEDATSKSAKINVDTSNIDATKPAQEVTPKKKVGRPKKKQEDNTPTAATPIEKASVSNLDELYALVGKDVVEKCFMEYSCRMIAQKGA